MAVRKSHRSVDVDAEPGPTVNTDKVCHIIVKARQFDAKEAVVEPKPEPGSNPADDEFRGVLEDYDDDPAAQELAAFIEALDVDEQGDIIALMWMGRGDYAKDSWEEARALAAERANERTAAYLIGTPLLGDYLEEGLSQFGLSCAEFESGRL